MMKRLLQPALALVLLLPAAPAAAQPAVGPDVFTVDRYLDYQTVDDPVVSPDGSQVVYTRRWIDRVEDRWESELWVMGADGSRNRFLARGSSPVWSPDGTRIAYLAEGEPRGTQLWVRWMDEEGATSQVTRVDESIGDVAWSPDGKRIGFTMFVPAKSRWRIDMPEAPRGAKWTEAPRHIDDLHYRYDRRGFLRPGHRHLFVVAADGGAARQVTSGDWSVGYASEGQTAGAGWSWSADGRSMVFDGFRETEEERTYRSGHIYAVDVESGAVRRLTREPGSWRSPHVSPDGRRIAFLGNPADSYSYRAANIYLMDLDGSNPRKISGSLDRDPGSLTWAPDGSGLYFTADDQGSRNLHFVSARGGEPRAVTRGAHVLSLGSVARSAAFGVLTSPQKPGDVVRIDLRRGATTQLTDLNAGLLAGLRLGEVEEIWYTSTGGARIQGWIVKPPAFDPAKKYPLILEIHGGPHAMYNVGFNPMFQNFAAHGYVVLYTNPRGSTGYGSDFGNAIQYAYPSVDHEDLMAGVDTVVGRGYVDTGRMFVGGCSGGGVLSSWAVAHTDRFAAAAVRCPVTNWISMAGQTDIPLFTYNFFEKPFWEDPTAWLEQSSLMHVGKVNTPTLVMTGELDIRTPMSQSEEYFAALRMRGVPAELLRFQGEYHGTGRIPSNWIRTQLYMMSWYERYGKGNGEVTGTR